MTPPYPHSELLSDAPARPGIADLVSERLPISVPHLEDLLRGHGLAPAPKNLVEVARLLRTGGRRAPFRVVRCGGMEIAVNRADHAVATGLLAASVRMTRYWGLASVPAVIDRTRAQLRTTVLAKIARDVLDAMPRALWLDDERQWFTFSDPDGRLEMALDKIFTLTGRVRLDELRAALAKGLPGVRHAPADALRRYLSEVARCEITRCELNAHFVRRPPSPGGHRPTRQEAALIRLIDGAGGELDLESVRQRASAVALPRTTINQLVKMSPLFLVMPHQRVRLIGDGHVAIYA